MFSMREGLSVHRELWIERGRGDSTDGRAGARGNLAPGPWLNTFQENPSRRVVMSDHNFRFNG
jgi:hypothetical protein